MAWFDDVQRSLGDPGRRHELGGWSEVERMLGASVPEDYRAFCDLFGACIIHDLLYVSHPSSSELNMPEVFEIQRDFLHDLRESDDPLDRIPWPLMDEGPGGMLLWGCTDVGDKCFLRPLADGTWEVCVWYREGEWHESGLSFSEWLHREVRGVQGNCNILRFRDVGPRYRPVD